MGININKMLCVLKHHNILLWIKARTTTMPVLLLALVRQTKLDCSYLSVTKNLCKMEMQLAI